MKRILGVDFLRGLWTLILLILHTYTNYEGDLTQVAEDVSGNPFASIVTFIARFPGLYYMLSGIAHGYVYYNKRKENKASSRDLFKQSIYLGGGLALLGKTLGFFFGRSSRGWGQYEFGTGPINYSIFGSLVETGNLEIPLFRHIVHFMGALQVLGISLMIYGTILSLLFRKSGYKNHKRNFVVLGIIVLLILILSPILIDPLHEIWVSSLIEEEQLFLVFQDLVWREKIGLFFKILKGVFIGFFVADTHPLLPFLSYGLLGCLFGMAYALLIPYKRIIIIGGIFAAINITLGAILYSIYGEPRVETILQTIQPRTMFMQVGIMTVIVTLVYSIEMRTGELHGNRVFTNKFFQRLNEGSLTIYSMEGFLAILIKYLIIDVLFPGWAASMIWVSLFGLSLIIFWYFLLTQWKKVKYVGSVEWLLSKFKPKISIRPEQLNSIVIEEKVK